MINQIHFTNKRYDLYSRRPDPDMGRIMGVAEAIEFILTFDKGNVIEATPTRIVSTSTFLNKKDTNFFEGSEEEIAMVKAGLDYWKYLKKNIGKMNLSITAPETGGEAYKEILCKAFGYKTKDISPIHDLPLKDFAAALDLAYEADVSPLEII